MRNYFSIFGLIILTILFTFTCIRYIKKITPSIGSESYPGKTGNVIIMEGSVKTVGKTTKFIISDAKVSFEWNNRNYVTSNIGLNFTEGNYRNAVQTGICTVYVNTKNPSDSVLSSGVPIANYVISIFLAIPSVGCFFLILYTIKNSD